MSLVSYNRIKLLLIIVISITVILPTLVIADHQRLPGPPPPGDPPPPPGPPGSSPGDPVVSPCSDECGNCASGGDPVFVKDGEFRLSETDVAIGGRGIPIAVTRIYGSYRDYNSQSGYNWDINYNLKIRRLKVKDDPNEILLLNGRGCRFEYRDELHHDIYVRSDDASDYIYLDGGPGGTDTFTLFKKNGTEYSFDINGNLSRIEDISGNYITFTYAQDAYGNDILLPVYGPSEFFIEEGFGGPFGGYGLLAMEYRLLTITHCDGRYLQLGYNENGLLSSITDHTGRTWSYGYSPTNDLITVTYPPADESTPATSITYNYDENNVNPADVHKLSSVVDARGNEVVSNHYDIDGRIWKQTTPDGDYNFSDDQRANDIVVVTDLDGFETEYLYNTAGMIEEKTVYDPATPATFFKTTYTYNTKMQIKLVTYPAGNCTLNIYDSLDRLKTVYEKTSPSDPCDRNHANVKATDYEYHLTFEDEIEKITDPEGVVTKYVYYTTPGEDGYGKVQKRIVDEGVDPSHMNLTWEYTYDSAGRKLTETNPVDMVTKYEYYADDDPLGYGGLWKVIKNYDTDPLCTGCNITTEFTYDSLGNMLTSKDTDGNVTQYEYDDLGRLKQVTGPAVTGPSECDPVPCEYITKYTYDENGNKKTEEKETSDGTNPWQTTTYVYDTMNRVETITDDLSNVTTYDYNNRGLLSSVEDPDGNETQYAYNERGLIDEITKITTGDYAHNVVTKFIYNNLGQLWKTVRDYDEPATYFNIISENEYDGFGRVKKVISHEGHYQEYTYDKLDRKRTEISYNSGNVALMQKRTEYDAAGHVYRQAVMVVPTSTAAINTAVDKVTDYNYNPDTGQLDSTVVYYDGGTSATTSYDYNDLGRRKKTTDPAGNITWTYYYDTGHIKRTQQKDDDPCEVTDLLITTDFEYDELGRRTKTIEKPNNPDEPSDPSWRTTTYDEYDALNNLTQVTKPNGVITRFEYDVLGRKAKEIADYGGLDQQVTEHTYHPSGRLWTISGYTDDTDQDTKQTTTYVYDDFGALKTITYPYPGPPYETVNYTYYPTGTVKTRTDQRGLVTNFYYYGTGLLDKTKKEVTIGPDTYTEEFTYDGLNRMTEAKKTKNTTTEISKTNIYYTSLGNIDKTEDSYFSGTAKTTDYDYEQAGFLTEIIYPDSDSSPTKFKITPDWAGRIDTITRDPDVTNDVIASYLYIGDQVTRRIYNTTTAINSDYSYDNLRRVTAIQSYHQGGSDIANFTYTYVDDTDNIDTQTYVHRQELPAPAPYSDFNYDNLDRLTSATYHDTVTEDFSNMDDLGNRSGNITLRSGTVNFTVDDDTNRYTSIGGSPAPPSQYAISYDEAGNLTKDHRNSNGYEYEYDYKNHLTKVTKPGTGIIVEYTYDALGRRIEKDESGTKTRYYYSDKQQVLAEYDGSGVFQKMNVYGNYIDELLYRRATGAPSRRFYVHDHLYSPVASIRALGTVSEYYEYDAYGNCLTKPADTTIYPNPYLFTGRRIDYLDNDNLALMYYRNRTYDTYTGRFLQHDPLGLQYDAQSSMSVTAKQSTMLGINQYKDGLNLYQYVKSHPTVNSDPFGLSRGIPQPSFPKCYNLLVNIEVLLHLGDEFIENPEILPEDFFDPENYPGISNDDFAHCYISCRLAQDCGSVSSFIFGWFREFVSVFLGMHPSISFSSNWDDSIDDMAANMWGIDCAYRTPLTECQTDDNENHCKRCCEPVTGSGGNQYLP